MGGLLYLLGYWVSSKSDQIKMQNGVIRNDQRILQTIQSMRQAADHSPGNKEELEDLLRKGQF